MTNTSNADILQRLVRRYLFKLERLKEEGIIVSAYTSAVLKTADCIFRPTANSHQMSFTV